MLQKIYIKRLGIVPIKENPRVNTAQKITFLSGCTGLGFEFKNPEKYNNSVLENCEKTIEILTEMRGGNVGKVPLFQGFPENIPDDAEYFEKRILGFVGNFLGFFQHGKTLSNGVIVPEWLFDIEEFGANPITQFQEKDLFTKALERQKNKKSDSAVSWEILEFVDEKEAQERVKKYLQDILYSKSSIKESLHTEVEFLLDYFGVDEIDFEKVVFKEIQAFISKFLWNNGEYGILKNLIKTPTDILRLLASLTHSDISLATNIKFPKFKRAQRRFILETLEKSGDLTDDFHKYKNLWKRLGEYLHPREYAGRYPKTAEYFQKIREGKLETFNAKLEKSLQEKDIQEVLDLVGSRAGIFGRKLHEILEKGSEKTDEILEKFEKIASKIELKNLLILKKYFGTIETSNYRTIINKKGKIKVLENRKNRLSKVTLKQIDTILQKTILSKLENNSPFCENEEKKKVFLSEDLKNIMIPLSSRKALDGYYTCGRGSQFDIDMNKTLRLFTYWKEDNFRTDVDLSVIFFDEDFNEKGHVSYTNLKSEGIVHSGDIQSAPHGAVEYIDLDLKKFQSKKPFFPRKEKNIRYISVQIYKYSGDDFEDIECFAGWQMREKIDSNYKSFDEKTVANKFDLYGKGSYFMPLIVDVELGKIIYTDLSINAANNYNNVVFNRSVEYCMSINAANNYNNVEGSLDTVEILVKEIIKFKDSKPNIYELINDHIQANNCEKVEKKEEADIICDVFDGDYNIKNAEKILAELL
ncbi:TerD family protein [Candidatus Gracilibacteria bacterium]|nr:TerD family protein [Candidatus Gracilibacteria bacterium]